MRWHPHRILARLFTHQQPKQSRYCGGVKAFLLSKQQAGSTNPEFDRYGMKNAVLIPGKVINQTGVTAHESINDM
jgi:hypothetical protein